MFACRTCAKLQVEWTLPPLRFRSAGAPGFYLNWLRTSLFAGALRADPDDDVLARTYYDAGVQLDLRLVLFSNLKSTLSLGYARAFRPDAEETDDDDEVMISLKIL